MYMPGQRKEGNRGFVLLTLLPVTAALMLLTASVLTCLYRTTQAMIWHNELTQCFSVLTYPQMPGEGKGPLPPPGYTVTVEKREAGPHLLQVRLVRDAKGRVAASRMEFVAPP
ncbi:MAG TPA: hypothetical protein DHV71_02150 [Acidaminococcaceae bacterium]|jgi:hypothetical protein|nr:hypothetical protein [Acidaminococcaceae bacterium]